ncbi:MAG: hypothetical protein ACHP6H_05185 [Legionellales bacterium]
MAFYRTAFIVNGSNLSPALPKVIGISQDNVNWTFLQKSQVRKVSQVYIPFVQASEVNRGYPWQDSAQIHIEMGSSDSISFDVQGIANQNSWVVNSAEHPSGTATTTATGLDAAVNAINGWL